VCDPITATPFYYYSIFKTAAINSTSNPNFFEYTSTIFRMLNSWLKDVACLEGKKLEVCLKACEDEMCETLADLRKSHGRPGGLSWLPKIIADLVGDALDANPAGAKEKATEENISKIQKAKQTQRESSATKNTDRTALQLPPDKIYHFFASHKVRSIFELRVFWLVCGSFAYLLSRKSILFMARYRRQSHEQQRIGWKLRVGFVGFSMCV
jgi:hypothetical protein